MIQRLRRPTFSRTRIASPQIGVHVDGLPVHFHGHNDFGMAVATELAPQVVADLGEERVLQLAQHDRDLKAGRRVAAVVVQLARRQARATEPRPGRAEEQNQAVAHMTEKYPRVVAAGRT